MAELAAGGLRDVRGFGPLEADIMKALWEAEGPLKVEGVRRRIPNSSLAYTTVMTVLNILVRKGLLSREVGEGKTGRAWFYKPVEPQEVHDARRMQELLYAGGDAKDKLTEFVSKLSPELRQYLLQVLPR